MAIDVTNRKLLCLICVNVLILFENMSRTQVYLVEAWS
jgi:hypothetical protein